mmetsp:Transcript_93918/g.167071  ORF Transcript_93918/g.167071 Transcript_93918/m.167071 type:complete len:207 (+) Transcript_93918:78-698(+)
MVHVRFCAGSKLFSGHSANGTSPASTYGGKHQGLQEPPDWVFWQVDMFTMHGSNSGREQGTVSRHPVRLVVTLQVVSFTSHVVTGSPAKPSTQKAENSSGSHPYPSGIGSGGGQRRMHVGGLQVTLRFGSTLPAGHSAIVSSSLSHGVLHVTTHVSPGATLAQSETSCSQDSAKRAVQGWRISQPTSSGSGMQVFPRRHLLVAVPA